MNKGFFAKCFGLLAIAVLFTSIAVAPTTRFFKPVRCVERVILPIDLAGSDLVITKFELKMFVTKGSTILQPEVTVKNIGSSDVTASFEVWVKYKHAGDPDTKYALIWPPGTIYGLKAGASKTVLISGGISVWDLPATLMATADYTNKVAESDETNNVLVKTW